MYLKLSVAGVLNAEDEETRRPLTDSVVQDLNSEYLHTCIHIYTKETLLRRGLVLKVPFVRPRYFRVKSSRISQRLLLFFFYNIYNIVMVLELRFYSW